MWISAMFTSFMFIVKAIQHLNGIQEAWTSPSEAQQTYRRGSELQLQLEYTKFKCKSSEKSKGYIESAHTFQVSFLASLLYKRSHPAFTVSKFSSD